MAEKRTEVAEKRTENDRKRTKTEQKKPALITNGAPIHMGGMFF